MFASAREMSEIVDLQQFFMCVESRKCHLAAEFFSLEDPMRSLLNSFALTELVTRCLHKIVEKPSFNVGNASRTGWTFFQSATVTASCTMLAPEPKPADMPLSTLPNNNLVGVVGPSAIAYTCYELRQASGQDRTDKLVESTKRVVHPGEIFALRAQDHAYTITAIEGSTTLLTLSGPVTHTTSRLFDKTTLRPFCGVASNPADSRIEAMVLFLQAYKSAESILPLTGLTRHPCHFVRWAALRAVGVVSPDDAMPLLHEACHDLHPHVQRAATRTLEALSKKRIA